MTGLFGTQAMPPDMQVEPPMRSCFSSTRAPAPTSSAASAATMPPPPDPTITRSTVVSHVVMSTSPTSQQPAVPRRSKLAGSVDDCYEAEVISPAPHEDRVGKVKREA